MAYTKTMTNERKLSAQIDALEREIVTLKFENKELRLTLKDFREINSELFYEITRLKKEQ